MNVATLSKQLETRTLPPLNNNGQRTGVQMAVVWVLSAFAQGLVDCLDYTTEAAHRMEIEEDLDTNAGRFGLDSPCILNCACYPDFGERLVDAVSGALRTWLENGLIESGDLHGIWAMLADI